MRFTSIDVVTGKRFLREHFFFFKSLLAKKIETWGKMNPKMWRYEITAENIAFNEQSQLIRYLPPLTLVWTGEAEHEYIFNDDTEKSMKI
jgi:hypothetical protein